ncbi:competence/damage-inducible protein A [Ferviditalea candida]|uniref:Putative competence-damage inducible protein n=1 Tax=Ferviditalea candida TaxID=3108399 RepID=A0ABU5ZJF9_9BACL|nr:competence/damage-inducible protein A [Paenibacillaceae bacterium T2]
MKAEIIAVGTELLMGQIVNTNAQFLSRQCASLGIDVYFQTVVGDNMSRLQQALQIAKDRADLIICTGGLGPTQDDLTKEAVALFTGRALVMDPPALENIKRFFEQRGIPMVDSNLRQAQVIEGCHPLPNDTGLAAGVSLTDGGTHYLLLPGPPKELMPMFDNYAIPWLRSVMKDETPLFSRILKFAGIGESSLEHQILDMIEAQSDPTIAPYAKVGEVTLRITTKALTLEQAEEKIMPVVQELYNRLGKYIYAEEDVPLEKAVVRLLTEKNLTLSTAESCTGGLLSEMITSLSGSSAVFKGGVVSYSNALKHQLLQIPMDVLEGEGAPGAVSDVTAGLMAENVRKLTGADIAVSVTGVAGPTQSENKPVGLVYIGLAHKNGETFIEKLQLNGGREAIRYRSAKHVLYRLWRLLQKSGM